MEFNFKLFEDIQEDLDSCRTKIFKRIKDVCELDKIDFKDCTPFDDKWRVTYDITTKANSALDEFLCNGYSTKFVSYLNRIEFLKQYYYTIPKKESE